jgi:acyl transferase domain-containing protein/thioesterase domain-containing protein/NAD(P)-dependent dehydrogenase (short-subunit alcohol dehydrogenase family)/acyl carrier protein
MPRERWPEDALGAPMARPSAGLLDDVERFDASFFNIPPREAAAMDPQHRLLLEVAWEALEDAAIVPERLAGSKTGVFVGIASHDYLEGIPRDARIDNPLVGTGNAVYLAAGRLAHTFGLRGPTLSINTACSSALVAIHLACQSLRRRESDCALAGGVNVILSPDVTRQLAALNILSQSGRCRTFDARADGYVRAEGCGVVVLKRLSDAQRDRDRIWALIRGSAVGHNGRAASLTAPSVQAQASVLRAALEDARVSPAQVGYVEVHSNGSPLGDPVELDALKEVLGQPRPDGSQCVLGSVKTNLGHAEAASGMASLTKAVLVLNHDVVPRNLHFERLNPHASLEGSPFVIPTSEVAWGRGSAPRIAGVSATGLGGTNAHVVLEAPRPPPGGDEKPHRPCHLLVLSARSAEALRDQAVRLIDHLAAHPEQRLGDVCHTAGAGRSHFEHRLALVASSREQVLEDLAAFLAGEQSSAFVRGSVARGIVRPKVAFVFAGDAAQLAKLDRSLQERLPVLQEAIAECDAAARSVLGRSESPMAASGGGRGELDLFALQYALARLWRSWGITPSAVAGEGVGEYVAACVAGLFRLEDAISLVTARRSPAELGAALSRIHLTTPRIPFVSGANPGDPPTTVGYWKNRSSASTPTKGAAAELARRGFAALLLVGPPQASLQAASAAETQLLPSLQQSRPDWDALLSSLGQLYARGLEVDWNELDKPFSLQRIAMPAYPFQRERRWLDAAPERGSARATPDEHPLLGNRLVPFAHQPDLGGWALPLGPERLARLGPTRVAGRSILLLEAWVDLALAAAHVELGERLGALGISIAAPAVLGAQSPSAQVLVEPSSDGPLSLRFFFRPGEGEPFRLAARATVSRPANAAGDDDRRAAPPRTEQLEEIPASVSQRALAMLGAVRRAPRFERIWRRGEESLASLASGSVDSHAAGGDLVRAAAYLGAITHPADAAAPWLAQDVAHLLIHVRGRAAAWLRLTWQTRNGREAALDAAWLAEDGTLVAEARGIRLVAADPFELLRRAGEDPLAQALHERIWIEHPQASTTAQGATEPRHFLILADRGGLGATLADRLRARGHGVALFFRDQLEHGSERLELMLTMNRLLSEVVHLWSLDAVSSGATMREAVLEGHRMASELLRLGSAALNQARPPRLWLVTRGAEPACGAALSFEFEAALLRGLGRGLARERPQLWGGAIDLDSAPDALELERMAEILAASDGEDQLVFRDGHCLVPRLARLSSTGAPAPLALRADRAYLVTGGLGMLGLLVARRLIERGARVLVLSSRSGLPERSAWDAETRSRPTRERIEAVRALESLGAKIHVEAADVADRLEMARVLERLPLPLGGVVHAAGAGGAVAKLLDPGCSEVIDSALRARILGGVTLHELTRDAPLEFFVLLASMAAVRAEEGREYEAMANHSFAVLARHRRAQGLAGSCLHVAPLARSPQAALVRQAGLFPLPDAMLLDAFERVILEGRAETIVASFDGDVVAAARDEGSREALFEQVAPSAPAVLARTEELQRRLALSGPTGGRRLLRDLIGAQLGPLLDRAPADLPGDQPLVTLGIDSIMGVQLTSALSQALDVALPVGLFLEHPTLDALAAHLAARLLSEPGDTSVAAGPWRYSPIQPLRTGGSRPPFFCVHPLVGVAMVFRPLALSLGEDQPFYGLQARGVDSDDPPLERVEDMAALYVKAMREVQPQGPYRIGGYSFGAYVAFEMAHQLERAGEKVDRLVILDAPAIDWGAAGASPLGAFLRWTGFDIDEADLTGLTPRQQRSKVALLVAQHLMLPPNVTESRRLRAVYEAHLAAMVSYRFAPCTGQITLLRASDTLAQVGTIGLDSSYGWSSLSGEPLEAHDVPGDHFRAIVEPCVQDLAAVLRRILA